METLKNNQTELVYFSFDKFIYLYTRTGELSDSKERLTKEKNNNKDRHPTPSY